VVGTEVGSRSFDGLDVGEYVGRDGAEVGTVVGCLVGCEVGCLDG
jgi:hypothetical protein